MSFPQFSDEPTEILGGGEKRDPSEFIPWDRIAEVKTPRGTRPGLTIIVRPLERIKEADIRGEKWRKENPDNDWKTLVIADIAILDAIPPGYDQYQMPLPPVPAGSQWRNQLVFPGMLNKAWRDKIGGTLIGIVYLGEARPMANGSMGKPPFLWRSLAQDQGQVQRGQRFFAAFPGFLVPVPRVNPAQNASGSDAWGQQPTMDQDPWAQPMGHQQADPNHWSTHQQQPQYSPGWQQDPQQQYPMQQPPMGSGMNPVYPVDPWVNQAGFVEPRPPQYQQHPAQMPPVPQNQPTQGHPYQQPDPWAQQPAQQVAPAQTAQQPPQQHPGQGLSTLEQMKLAAAQQQQGQQVNHHGQQQPQDPPF